jgi:hypothetical protein
MIHGSALSRVLAHALPLEPHEAVAVAQQFVFNRVVAGEPVSVSDAGDVLEALLAETRVVPAPLRYTVARARGIVEAPPFASVSELAVALKRFERGDRASVVRAVLVRISPGPRRRSRAIAAAVAIAASAVIGAAIGKVIVKRAHPAPATAPVSRSAPTVGTSYRPRRLRRSRA